jgi:hypothetical protein
MGGVADGAPPRSGETGRCGVGNTTDIVVHGPLVGGTWPDVCGRGREWAPGIRSVLQRTL